MPLNVPRTWLKMTKLGWGVLHSAQRLASIPFLIAEIIIRLLTLGCSQASPSAWWSIRCLKFCVNLRRDIQRRNSDTATTTGGGVTTVNIIRLLGKKHIKRYVATFQRQIDNKRTNVV